MGAKSMIFQLLYISSATRKMSQADIESILLSARRSNEGNAITGLLLSSPGRFMQVLEGDEAMVRQTYQRICADPRHHAPVILRETQVAQRQFGEWTMASHAMTDETLGNIVQTVRHAVADCDAITSAYLLGFAEKYAA